LSDEALVLIAVSGDARAGSFLKPALHKSFNVLKVFAVIVSIDSDHLPRDATIG